MIDTPSGIVGGGKSSDMLLATQRLPFEVQGDATDADPDPEGFRFDGSLAENRRPYPTGRY